jgi:hypothetical protein
MSFDEASLFSAARRQNAITVCSSVFVDAGVHGAAVNTSIDRSF